MRTFGIGIGRVMLLILACEGTVARAQQSPHGPISIACTNCHTTESWSVLRQPLLFDHSKTGFALDGGHLQATCRSCHEDLKFTETATDCYSCHRNTYASAKDPNHVAGRISQECRSCHTTISWRPSIFNHAKTNFPLIGAHRAADCASCHAQGVFAGLSAECISCHQTDYTNATNPNHVAGGIPRECAMCHSSVAWIPSSFQHSQTGFPLTGAHANTPCLFCHKNQAFRNTPSDCYSCHSQDYASTTDPNHVSGQFSHDCRSCHATTAWKPASFNHDATIFPLTGAHRQLPCESCHQGGKYAGTTTDCYGCHQANFASTTDPNHVSAGFDHNCTMCHTTTAWKPSTFNHDATGFRLTGAHATTACLFCHKNQQYGGTPSDCYSCHQADYTSAPDPNHVALNFDHVCSTCHSTSAWKPATFDHNLTAFRLTGAHIQTPCASCHVGGRYAGTPQDCYACHKSDYDNTLNPNHVAWQYPTACQNCHATTAWRPSSFDHTLYFPIGTGAKHRPGVWSTCADCHVNPASITQFSCITCHEHDQPTMNSKHSEVSGYQYSSPQCYRCHPQGKAD